MASEKRILSSFFKMALGISVEIFATLTLMAVVFILGFFILRLFSK